VSFVPEEECQDRRWHTTQETTVAGERLGGAQTDSPPASGLEGRNAIAKEFALIDFIPTFTKAGEQFFQTKTLWLVGARGFLFG
jgi:hypothetical protein